MTTNETKQAGPEIRPGGRMKLKYPLIAILAVVVAVVLTETYMNTFGADTRPSAQLKEEVARTQRSARNLDTSYAAILPPPPPGHQSPGRDRDTEPAQAGPTTNHEPPPPGTYQDGEVASKKEPDPTEAPYNNRLNPADVAARAAVDESRQRRAQLDAGESEYATAVQTFYDEWSSRYQNAAEEHRRFRWRLQQADRTASQYFHTQADLTRRMPNAERRGYYVIKDQEEQELYREWQLQAHEILGQSNSIMLELRQLNLEITKQTLSADFATLYQEFHQIPTAITTLHSELDLFRQRSQQLENQFTRG